MTIEPNVYAKIGKLLTFREYFYEEEQLQIQEINGLKISDNWRIFLIS